MKLKFEKDLEYQLDAINAVVDLFDGQPLGQTDFEISQSVSTGFLPMQELGVGNYLMLDDETLLKNVHKIQERNGIPLVPSLQGRNFSIEMETGTGKTYVYLRTIFELNRKYGFKKFIIVVPSVAIREGTLKNLQITEEHFKDLYNNVPYDYYVYDSKKVSQLRQFATSNQIQILVINIDAFRKKFDNENYEKGNVIHRENDKLSGRKPVEFIQATNPILIIDEPQSVDNTPKAKAAIATLNPLLTLRYSATHRNPYNMLYKLDPIQAYDLGLVKRIEVDSVMEDGNFNTPFIKLINVDNRNGIKAKVEVYKERKSRIKKAKLTVKQGDDLFLKTNRDLYKDGYIVSEISCEPGNEYIQFNTGKRLYKGESQGDFSEEIMKVQVKKTIEEHFEKELKMKDRGIKVLSLFFIDRVANYRSYENGKPGKGKIAKWFEQSFNDLKQREIYKNIIPFPLEKIHDGYFAQDKKGKLKDSKTGKTKDDEDVYNKIMKDKERLLSPAEPLRFIFSHSALREGWDNPNVFQICTLNETKSEIKKRQEIGRGLRLPVNQKGERVFDESINRLTVIANESYEDFARNLQAEIEEDFEIKFGRLEKSAFAKIKIVVDGEEKQLGSVVSEEIWNELKNKGYIDNNGDLQPKFQPEKEGFDLEIDDKYDDLKLYLIDKMSEYLFRNRVVNKNKRTTLKLNKQVYLDTEFKKLWDKIKHRTTYSVEYDTDELVEKAVKEIKNMETIKSLKIKTVKSVLDLNKGGIETRLVKAGQETLSKNGFVLPDILAYLQKETELTRGTLLRILKESGRLSEFPRNPQKFMSNVAKAINRVLKQLIVDGIKYEKITGKEYEMRLFEEQEIVRYLNNLVEVKNSVYNAVEYDSNVEKRFVEELDKREDIKLFVRLPSWFKIETPIGSYNPDWAIVKENDKTLYLVRETKSTKDFEKLRNSEAFKIKCGKSHFKSLGVDFDIASKAEEV